MQTFKASELKLADVVLVWAGSGPFSSAIVKQVTKTKVTLFRPYGTTADFSFLGGVLCYVGIEEITIPRNDFEYQVASRKNLR